MLRSDSIIRVSLTLLFLYLFSFGATFNAVLIPELSFVTLGLMTFLVFIWLIARWRGNWQWYPTPLDWVFVLWVVVFAISLFANQESWRRTFIGFWYVGVYIGVWYALYDALANKAIQRNTLIDGFMLGSLIVVVFGILQIALTDFDLSARELPRLSSTIGNPNAFGMFLLVLVMIVLGRLAKQKSPLPQIVLGGYALILILMLLLTFSRGVLLGAVVAFLTFGLLLTQRLAVRRWWRDVSRLFKLVVTSVGVIGLMIAGLVVAALVQQTFGTTDRALGLRANIYSGAVTVFTEKPLIGHGLFTFGQELARTQSQPEEQPHSHAHNIILHIAAELGIPGLIVLFVTTGVILWRMRRHWQVASPEDRPVLAGFVAAVIGFGAAHLFDTPSMMPLIALVGIFILTFVMTLPDDSPMQARWRVFGVIGLWGILLVSGFWSANLYAQYNSAVIYGITEEDYRGAADRLQPIIDADPNLGLYHNQQGYLYGFAANEGDVEAVSLGIAAYERYLEIEPQDAVAWMNLGALYWQANRPQEAIDALERTIESAPNSWQARFNQAIYAELSGNEQLAYERFKRVIRNEYNLMSVVWDDTAFRREIAAIGKPTQIELIVLALTNDTHYATYDPELLWWRSGLDQRETTDRYVLRLLMALWLEDPQTYEPEQFDMWLVEAEKRVEIAEDQSWVYLGRSALLRYQGDIAQAEIELERAREIITPDLLKQDYKNGINMAHFQYLRFAITRQFLPQVYYPTIESLPLMRLLDES